MVKQPADWLPPFPAPRRPKTTLGRRSILLILACTTTVCGSIAFASRIGWTPTPNHAKDDRQQAPAIPSSNGPERPLPIAVDLTDQTPPAKLDSGCRHATVRPSAVKQLRDQSLLTRMALLDKDPSLRRAAIEHLFDQDSLARIAEKTRDTDVGEAAVGKLSDEMVLARVAMGAEDKGTRRAAVQILSNRLGRKWSDVESWTSSVRKAELVANREWYLRYGQSSYELQPAETLVVQDSYDSSVSLAFAKLAERALQKGDYDFAIKLFRTAIVSNSDDKGTDYDPFDVRVHDGDSLLHGQEQVVAMVADRPQMSAFLKPSDDLYKWAVRMYARRINQGEINWSPAPTRAFSAEHSTPVDGRPGVIRINAVPRDSMTMAAAFEHLWGCAAFELHNIEGAEEFLRIHRQAIGRLMTEEAYVKAMFLTEWIAVQRTRRFYVEVFLPHAKRYQLRSDRSEWKSDDQCWNVPETEFALYTDKSSYPWVPYSSDYRTFHVFPSWAGNAAELH